MFEPHLDHHHLNDDDGGTGDSSTILEELDRLAPIKSFDAFPKVQSSYTIRSRRGGVLTAVVGLIIFLLVLNDLGEYLYGSTSLAVKVDPTNESNLQLNVDITVAMPCRYLSIDLRDGVGDRVHLDSDFAKEGTVFETGNAITKKLEASAKPVGASKMISESRRSTPNQRTSLSGLRALFSRTSQTRHADFRPTHNRVHEGPACRVYGSVQVRKVAANLHVTTLGHGYRAREHTDHQLMNLSHVIHEFSFGPYFPAISQPLDMSLETTDEPFTAFQYYLRVVPTTYIDASRRLLTTSQYAVTDYVRSFHHGGGVPGIFFKYELEPMSITIRERTTTLYQFLIRLVGVVGGVWTVAAFALRIANRAQREVVRVAGAEKDVIPSSIQTRRPSAVSRAASWMSAGDGIDTGSDWKRR